MLTRVLRTFGYGYLAVVLAIYLEQVGLSSLQIGLVLTGAIAGSAVMTVFRSLVADRYGRRKTVASMALLMVVGGLLFALSDNFWLLLGASRAPSAPPAPRSGRSVHHCRAGGPAADRAGRASHLAVRRLRYARQRGRRRGALFTGTVAVTGAAGPVGGGRVPAAQVHDKIDEGNRPNHRHLSSVPGQA